jgi:hypothetical protein
VGGASRKLDFPLLLLGLLQNWPKKFELSEIHRKCAIRQNLNRDKTIGFKFFCSQIFFVANLKDILMSPVQYAALMQVRAVLPNEDYTKIYLRIQKRRYETQFICIKNLTQRYLAFSIS